MSTVNRVILIGEVEKQPVPQAVLSELQSRFVLVTRSVFKRRKDDEEVTITQWHRIVVKDSRLAEESGAFKDGELVYVEGQSLSRKLTNKDGEERWISEVVVAPFKGRLRSVEPGKGGFASGPQEVRPDDLEDWEAGGGEWFE